MRRTSFAIDDASTMVWVQARYTPDGWIVYETAPARWQPLDRCVKAMRYRWCVLDLVDPFQPGPPWGTCLVTERDGRLRCCTFKTVDAAIAAHAMGFRP